MRLVVAAIATLLISSVARAEDGPSAEERAMVLTQRALVHYRAGELEQSLELLQNAEQLVHQPVIIYNLARVHEAAGDLEDALLRYQEYLELAPDPPDRGAVTARIETLETQIEEREQLREEQEAAREDAQLLAARALEAERRAAQARSGGMFWSWLMTGLGVAVLATATILGALALGEANDVHDDMNHLAAQEAQERADDLALGANVCFVTGGVLTGAGLIWGFLQLFLSRRDPVEPATANLTGAFP